MCPLEQTKAPPRGNAAALVRRLMLSARYVLLLLPSGHHAHVVGSQATPIDVEDHSVPHVKKTKRIVAVRRHGTCPGRLPRRLDGSENLSLLTLALRVCSHTMIGMIFVGIFLGGIGEGDPQRDFI